MSRLDALRPTSVNSGLTRRDFLHAGAVSTLALTVPDLFAYNAIEPERDVNCIMLLLVGGPSQIDTWDPKPAAPSEVRSPFRPIATNVPGIRVTEIFPRMARHADKFSIIRSVTHIAPAIHDTGHQLMQTGRAFSDGIEHPHVGCVLDYVKGKRGDVPAHVILPRLIGYTGGAKPHGDTAGYLGRQYDPFIFNAEPATLDLQTARMRAAFALNQESAHMRERYGRTRFGQSCLLARRLIEQGVRFVTVNMFDTVFDEATWDIHGSGPFTDMGQMANDVAPNFDRAYTALLEDLTERGLYRSTMVVATGEFGRTPKINSAGGRDHHPGVWSMLIGGGPIHGGRIVGESDEIGYLPKSRPVTPGEVAATLYRGLGIDPQHPLPGLHGRPIPAVDFGMEPIRELF